MYEIIYNFIIILSVLCTINFFYIAYGKFLKFNQILQKNNKKISYYQIICTSFSFITTLIKMFFINKIQNYLTSFCVKKINNNIFEVTLCINKKIVKVMMKIRRGPSNFIQILDGENEVKDKIEPYLNYEIIDVTPGRINLDDLDFYYITGDVK